MAKWHFFNTENLLKVKRTANSKTKKGQLLLPELQSLLQIMHKLQFENPGAKEGIFLPLVVLRDITTNYK